MEYLAFVLLIAVLGTLYLLNRLINQRQQLLDAQFKLNTVPEIVNNDFLLGKIEALNTEFKEYKLSRSIGNR